MMAIQNKFMELWQEKERKERRRISLTEVCEKSGVGWSTANRWKRDNVDRFDSDVLEKLCIYFDCQVGDLLTYIPNEAKA